MVAFEVSVNGQPLYTMVAGEFGSLAAHVHWMRVQRQIGGVVEETRVNAFALNDARKTHQWPTQQLKVGDELTIRIIDSGKEVSPLTHPTWWK